MKIQNKIFILLMTHFLLITAPFSSEVGSIFLKTYAAICYSGHFSLFRFYFGTNISNYLKKPLEAGIFPLQMLEISSFSDHSRINLEELIKDPLLKMTNFDN